MDIRDDDRGFRSARPPKAQQSSLTLAVAKFDGTRTGKRYTGHLWTDAGSQGTAIQWIFDCGNDPGTSSVIGANEYVQVVTCPTWLKTNAAFGSVATYGEKYIAIAPIWGVLA